jgi:glycerol-3-phosphate dehydrogenase
LDYSLLNRPKFIHRLRNEQFDLLIIGGGITGAGIALDAASRGLKVALVEKSDFASGTSSKSTKLIHGGLRYLKQLEFGLVREVGSERAVVHRLAPHLVLPEKMLLPLYESRGFGSTLTSVGLMLYDWLAGVKPEDRRKMLTKKQTLRAEPLLRDAEIKGGALYAEYRTDDARLTIELMKTAFRHGAVPVNYCEVMEFLYEGQRVSGAEIKDHLSGETFPLKAVATVNAAGPWVDELRELNRSRQGKSLHLTKGVHVTVRWERLPVKQAVYFDVGDGRMIFAIPRGGCTYIGTTDTTYTGDKNDVRATREDVDYLLNAVNHTFRHVPLEVRDVESSWAGLRPLIHEEGKSASELSRKDEIFRSSSGLISIAGGKLTGYRKMAERVIKLVIEEWFQHRFLEGVKTNDIPLTVEAFSSYDEVENYVNALLFEARGYGADAQHIRYLVHAFGKQAIPLLQGAKQFAGGDIAESLVLSELNYCIEHELTTSAEDFFIRRTGMLYFDPMRLIAAGDAVTAHFGKVLGWSEDKLNVERHRLKDSVILSTQFE